MKRLKKLDGAHEKMDRSSYNRALNVAMRQGLKEQKEKDVIRVRSSGKKAEKRRARAKAKKEKKKRAREERDESAEEDARLRRKEKVRFGEQVRKREISCCLTILLCEG